MNKNYLKWTDVTDSPSALICKSFILIHSTQTTRVRTTTSGQKSDLFFFFLLLPWYIRSNMLKRFVEPTTPGCLSVSGLPDRTTRSNPLGINYEDDLNPSAPKAAEMGATQGNQYRRFPSLWPSSIMARPSCFHLRAHIIRSHRK